MPTPSSDFSPTFDGLLELVATLRGPDGCPWDKEQTRHTLKRYLLEETYELLETIDEDDSDELPGELGDVLFNLAFQIHLGIEEKTFDDETVFAHAIAKLVRRHPHVFGEVDVSGTDQVRANWWELKRQERNNKEASALDGVPKSMPALSTAQSIQDRAAGVGFDWDDVDGVIEKVREELDEFQSASDSEQKAAEMGDVFFSLVNLSRWLDIDAEATLREANGRFSGRFAKMEELSRERETPFESLLMDEKESLWEEAKGLVG